MKPLLNHVPLSEPLHRCHTQVRGQNPASTSGADSKDQKKLKDAASQFEALLIGQLLKSASTGDGAGWGLGEGDDDANSTLVELGQEQFSRALSSNGGLGFAQIALKSLEKTTGPQSSALTHGPDKTPRRPAS